MVCWAVVALTGVTVSSWSPLKTESFGDPIYGFYLYNEVPYAWATGIGANSIVGVAEDHVTGDTHATVWSAPRGRKRYLSSIGGSIAYSTDGSQNVGWIPGAGAVLWTGFDSHAVFLQPPGATFSEAFGVSDGIQAGRVDGRPWVWNNGPPGTVLGTPAGGGDGYARDVRIWNGAEFVVGDYSSPGPPPRDHAVIWVNRQPVDVHPSGFDVSRIVATDGNYHVGYAQVLPSGYSHAIVWSGPPGSFVWEDVHPAGKLQSRLTDTSNGQACGWFEFIVDGNLHHHAGLWTSKGLVDLHGKLPPLGPGKTWDHSEANGIFQGKVVGSAVYSGNQRYAILWDTAPDLPWWFPWVFILPWGGF